MLPLTAFSQNYGEHDGGPISGSFLIGCLALGLFIYYIGEKSKENLRDELDKKRMEEIRRVEQFEKWLDEMPDNIPEVKNSDKKYTEEDVKNL